MQILDSLLSEHVLAGSVSCVEPGVSASQIADARSFQRHAALVAGVHAFVASFQPKDVDGRDKPGHDAE